MRIPARSQAAAPLVVRYAPGPDGPGMNDATTQQRFPDYFRRVRRPRGVPPLPRRGSHAPARRATATVSGFSSLSGTLPTNKVVEATMEDVLPRLIDRTRRARPRTRRALELSRARPEGVLHYGCLAIDAINEWRTRRGSAQWQRPREPAPNRRNPACRLKRRLPRGAQHSSARRRIATTLGVAGAATTASSKGTTPSTGSPWRLAKSRMVSSSGQYEPCSQPSGSA